MPDLAWPDYRVAAEYEGDYHRDRDQFRRDIRRLERLIDHGWIVLRVSADDVFDRPEETVTRIARRLGERGYSGGVDLRQIGKLRR